jgi:hypothetical protein
MSGRDRIGTLLRRSWASDQRSSDEVAGLVALASVEFVVKEADTAGGPGADFLVKWSGLSGADEPSIEAVMLGRNTNAGISFTSVGRVITNEP